jgi:alkanesulfonate monooxygenase SsuD/methylene tetrahydromethanopterin reductase-like flavin-dependent oxidoreductase (luciferase family)
VGSPNPGALARVRAGIADLRARLGTRLVIAALGPQMCRLAGEIGDGVLLNWVSPEYAHRSADLVREGAAKAGRPAPKIYAYVRLALGPGAHDLVLGEANRYAKVPAYGANFDRMGVKPETTAIAALTPDEIAPALAKWHGVVDEVVLRAIPAADTIDDTLALVRAARP